MNYILYWHRFLFLCNRMISFFLFYFLQLRMRLMYSSKQHLLRLSFWRLTVYCLLSTFLRNILLWNASLRHVTQWACRSVAHATLWNQLHLLCWDSWWLRYKQYLILHPQSQYRKTAFPLLCIITRAKYWYWFGSVFLKVYWWSSRQPTFSKYHCK